MTAVDDYVASLPDDRRAAIAILRDTVNANIPRGYEEGIQFGMPAWYIPLARYPETYNKAPLMLVGLASQKTHMAMYLMGVYGDATLRTWFEKEFRARGKKLDMGKSCMRFKSLDALPLDLVGEVIGKISVEKYIEQYELVKGPPKPAPKPPAKKAPAKKPPAKKR